MSEEPPLGAAELLLHVKFVPRYNDSAFIQHADDQINDGTGSGAAHENARTVIGSAIESYQGWKTVEVWKGATLHWSELDVLLYSERAIETLKTITWTPIETGMVRVTFRMRAETGSTHYTDYDQYVYIALHNTCGTEGA